MEKTARDSRTAKGKAISVARTIAEKSLFINSIFYIFIQCEVYQSSYNSESVTHSLGSYLCSP